jgi:hypothetical protein
MAGIARGAGMVDETSGTAPIVVRFSLAEEEERLYGRVVASRQNRAAGEDIAWYSHLGAIPVGFLGGFAAIWLGVDWDSGAVTAMLIGIAYLLGHYACLLAARLYGERLFAAYRHQAPGHGEDMTVTIDETGVESQWRKSHIFWGWEDITALTLESGLLLFWIGPSRGIFLPRRALAKAEETQILGLAKARVGRKA